MQVKARGRDYAGLKFNRLTGVEKTNRLISGSYGWRFRCDCGNEIVCRPHDVTAGLNRSCGCFQRENASKMGRVISRTHGMSKTPTHKVWQGMLGRCLNKNSPVYPSYGGRGIQIEKRWLAFENFLADMGKRPCGKSLDRINNNGNYGPKNCRWATPLEQGNNKRNNRPLTYMGETKNLSQWARHFNLSVRLIHHRLNRGWPVDEKLFWPSRSVKKFKRRSPSATCVRVAEACK